MTTSLALRGALLGIAAMAAYGINDNLIKFLGAGYNPFQIIFFSSLAVMPLLMGQMALDREGGDFRPRMPRLMALRCAIALINTVFIVFAFASLPLAQTYAIVFSMPLIITVLAAWLLNEPISPARGLAVVVGFVGVIIALQPGSAALQWGHLAAILGAIFASLNFLILRKTSAAERPAVQIIYPTLTQLAAAALILPFVYVPMPFSDIALTGAMAVCGTIGSFLIIAAYRLAPVIIVAPMQYTQILMAALTSALIFHEPITQATWVGLVVIMAAGTYILTSARGADATLSS